MQKTILEMAERLKFDKMTIGQLKQVSEYLIKMEEQAKQAADITYIDKSRIGKLERELDRAEQVIEAHESGIAHG
jgi:hypothetical protein